MDYRERWELRNYLFGRRLERRILLFHVAMAAVLIGFALDFWYLQGVKAEEYATLAENNLRRRIPMKAPRGEIFDRRGEIVASARPSIDLLLRRDGRHPAEPQLERLAPIVGQTYETLAERWRTMRGRPLYEAVVLAEDVGLEQLAHIEARREQFPSVEVRQTARRHYPGGAVVPHAVGYVGEVSESRLEQQEDPTLQRGDIVGKAGIERLYDDVLRGGRGWELVAVNNLGRQIGSSRVEREPRPGDPVTLTIDLGLQRVLVAGLGEERGAGVFMDVGSGEILAIASSPHVDPNAFADGISHDEWQAISADPGRPLHDRAIASFYAPGSTFKVVLAVAGLESGTIGPHVRRFCNGSATIYGRRRLCWKKGGHGWVDLERALAESCNVYFYELGKELEIGRIERYGRLLGFGRPSGIESTGEEAGILPSAEWKRAAHGEPWYPGDTISVAIGQGLLAVTPIQLARMMAGVATGELVRPRLVAGPREAQPLGIAPENLSLVRKALARAVTAGTAGAATRGKFTVAGKTGTAQIYAHSAGIDSMELPKAERDHAWFVGYAPADHPRVAFAVVVEHGGHGGHAAAPIVRQVLEAYFEDPPPAAAVDPELRARLFTRPRGSDATAPAVR